MLRLKRKIFYAEDEWKYVQGKVVVIVKDLYGLKSSTLAWRNNSVGVLGNYMGFKYLLYYPDLWFKASTDKYGHNYYIYIVVYVDNILIMEKDTHKFMSMLIDKYTVKPSIIGYPNLYLFAYTGKVDYRNESYTENGFGFLC